MTATAQDNDKMNGAVDVEVARVAVNMHIEHLSKVSRRCNIIKNVSMLIGVSGIVGHVCLFGLRSIGAVLLCVPFGFVAADVLSCVAFKRSLKSIIEISAKSLAFWTTVAGAGLLMFPIGNIVGLSVISGLCLGMGIECLSIGMMIHKRLVRQRRTNDSVITSSILDEALTEKDLNDISSGKSL